MAVVRVSLLGRFAVELDGERVPAGSWRRRRPVDLLKLLASRRGHALARDAVIDAIWPEMDAERGAKNLHRALHDLRKIIGADRVVRERGVLRLSDDVVSDVAELERLASSEDMDTLERAVELYRGPLCAEDDDAAWLVDRRASLRDAYVAAATRVARHHVTTGAFDRAVDHLRQLLDLEPAYEAGHRLLMRALASSGNPAEALRQFERCAAALADSLDAEPDAQTVRLRDQIREGGQAASVATSDARLWSRILRRLTGTSSPPPMFGREPALRSLDAVCQTIAEGGDGTGHTVLIAGPAGTGKSRLVAELVTRAGEARVVALAGSTSEFGTSLPFAPFAEAWIEHVRAGQASVADDPIASFRPAGGQPQEDTLRLFQAVEQALLREADDPRPVLLIIEDLQWADESSLHLFHYLARAARSAPLVLVGTARSEEAAPGSPLHALLANLRREKLALRVGVSTLSAADTARQVRHLSDQHETYRMADRIHALGGGNPLFTEELLQAHVELGGESAAITSESLSDVVLGRVSRLSEDAARLLQVASVAGREFALAWARDVLEMDEGRALDALDLALRSGLVHEVPGGTRFRHALVREVIYTSLPSARRTQWHAGLAQVLRQPASELSAGARDSVLAHHYSSAGQSADALPHFITAGRQAMKRIGFVEALRFFERAKAIIDELSLTDGPQRFMVLKRLGMIHFALSEVDAAVSYFDAALAVGGDVDDAWRPSDAECAVVLKLAAGSLITVGDLDAADELLARARDLLPSGDPRLPQVLYTIAQLRWGQGRHAEARQTAEQILQEAGDDDDARAKGYEVMALVCHSMGEWQEGIDAVEKRKAIVGDSVDVAEAFDAHL
jgi:DNA-binding SARP family transcriptional activator